MAEFSFLKYCKLRLTAAGYPASVQVEILELGFQRNWMSALHTGIANWLPVETVQRGVLKNVVEEYLKVRGAAIVGTDTPDEGNVTQLLKSLGIGNIPPELVAQDEPEEASVDAVGQGEQQIVANEGAKVMEEAPIGEEVTASPENGVGGTDGQPHAAEVQEPVAMDDAVSDAIVTPEAALEFNEAAEKASEKPADVVGEQEEIGTSGATDASVRVPRTSSPLGNSSPAPTANTAAQDNDSENDGQERNDCSIVAGTVGRDVQQEQLGAACEEAGATLSDIIDQVVRNKGEVTDLDAPAGGNALALLTYDYRKCLVDKREALLNPGLLQGTLQEQLVAARAHFHSSTVANNPYISRIIQSLSAHIWDPSSDPQQPFPYHKNIAAPCTKKMYAEWNLTVNGVLKRFSNEAFMTWKHNKTQEFYEWEELKGVVDMFMLEQIQKGIITGDLEKKTRNKRKVDNSGPAPKRARKDVVEDEDRKEEAGPSCSGSTQKEKVNRMRQRYGNLKE
ncbi:unnamed protein product [Caenorhabditis brenneri]